MRKISEVSIILKQAKTYCEQQGVRFTNGRAAVLEYVAKQQTPVKAYDVLQAISKDKSRQMPPLVYRALDFWTSHGFLHRIEGLNAYTCCTHPGCGHECQIFICSKCGKVSEICDPELGRQVTRQAESQGLRIDHLRIEASGLCPNCC
jgi:Fur family zinc uptake transcriptional regulator